MAIISVTSPLFTHSDKVVSGLSKELGYQVVTDNEIIEQASRTPGIHPATLHKVVASRSIPFNNFTHEKEKNIAALKKSTVVYLGQGNIIFHGLLGHLIPTRASHSLQVLILSNRETRIQNGMRLLKKTEKELAQAISEADRRADLWVKGVTRKKAWDESLYDIIVKSDNCSTNDAIERILEHHDSLPTLPGNLLKKKTEDLLLAAEVELALAELGGRLIIRANAGNIEVAIDKRVLYLTKLKHKISTIAKQIPGITSVKIKIGKNYYRSSGSHHETGL